MTSIDRPRHPDRKLALKLFAVIGLAFAGASCDGQSHETRQNASVLAARAAAPGNDTDVEAPVISPLVQAAHHGDVEAAGRELREGADVDAVSALGMTPLMWSFQPLVLPPKASGDDPAETRAFFDRQKRKLQIARMLLERGADLALVDDHGMTALHYLALMDGEEQPLVETLRAFREKGADPNVSNKDGLTPLMFAAFRNRPRLTEHLLSAGADPKAVAGDGSTALSIARERGHSEVVEVLERQSP